MARYLLVRRSAIQADWIFVPSSGSDGDLIDPTYLDANTHSADPGSWAYTSPLDRTTTLKVRSGGLSSTRSVLVDGVTYAPGSTRAQFDMETVWAARKTISSVSVANPSTITTSASHGYSTGDRISIEGNVGGTEINTVHVITVTGAATFTIPVNVTSAGTGGSTFKAWDSFAWTPGATFGEVVLGAIMQFNATGITTASTGLDHFNLSSGAFGVLQQVIGAGQVSGDPNSTGTLNAHGQTGAGSTVGPGFVVERDTTYLVTLLVSFSEQRMYVMVQDEATGAFIGSSACDSEFEIQTGLVTWQNYLVVHGGTTDIEKWWLDYSSAQFPIVSCTLPAPVVDAEQTDADEITITWTSGAVDLLIERSSNGGSSWSTLEAAYAAYLGSYIDSTVVDASTYRYRLTASVTSNLVSAAATTDDVLVDNGGFALQPDDVAGLVLWLKADVGVEEASGDAAEDSDTVQFWRDQSGNADDLEQATGGNRPTYKTNIINGLPVVRMAVGKSLVSTSIGTTLGTAFVVVGNVTHSSANAVAGMDQSASPKRLITFFPNATTVYSGDGTEIVGTAFTNYVNGVATSTFPGSGAFGAITQRRNSTTVTHDGVIRLGQSAANDDFIGDVAELILYDSVIDVADRTGIEAYLMDKYAL